MSRVLLPHLDPKACRTFVGVAYRGGRANPAQAYTQTFYCRLPHGHDGDHVAIIDGEHVCAPASRTA